MLALGFSSSLFLTLHPAYHLDYGWSNSMGISAGEENPTTKANFQEAKDGQNICLEDEKICCSKKENQQGQLVLCLKTSFSFHHPLTTHQIYIPFWIVIWEFGCKNQWRNVVAWFRYDVDKEKGIRSKHL